VSDRYLSRGFDFASKRKIKIVDVPELECKVILKKLSIGQLDELENDITKQLALMIVDEHGDRIYVTPDEIAILREMESEVAMRLLKEASTLNGATAEAVEEAVKNYEASRNGDSVTV